MSTKEIEEEEFLTEFTHDPAEMFRTDPYLEPEAAFDRLEAEYYKYGSLTIGYDFDGTG